MIINKVYAGWVIRAEGEEMKVMGSMKIRGGVAYIVKCQDGAKRAINRADMLAGFESGEIKYVRSEAA